MATSEANNLKLEQSVASQKAVIEQQANDFKKILEINKDLEKTNKTLAAEFAALDKRFNKINGLAIVSLASLTTIIVLNKFLPNC